MPSDSLVHREGQSPVKFSGDLTPQQQAGIVKFADVILRGPGDFAKAVGSCLELTEVSISPRPEDGKLHAAVVFEIDVLEDMLNANRHVHGGCSMFMIDICSAIALTALSIAMNKRTHLVSQAINTIFHAPATVGARLKIVNKTVAYGTRTVSARTEIWDITNRRLVVSGIHNQMQPSPPKL
ncbi:hypothetical protein BD309DRAFT_871870 [Dichomitus squalens]|uniref:Uncharacterized protein n=1 Tax=Dichomitus squalens TaxID=114155 RepID=A0A4Q9NEY5_9APHY|nr:uncharacterized protein DICSQDRAFT_132509 [Dichomitus squalens LYAD-421 SS1]EJF66366.1 hypothetical protein DICSQDRAFT_132509 [Dichomitus squalens LYAD-421 SS1]TBU35364.1 hypothetical protein BD311DRAFT_743854 [Dichomitus squalens]TBU39660.1 hypothetical protein BD309DRAFT_871870 [Dichomitus squalens]